MSEAFRILSVDGGGFRGAFSAHVLARVEEEYVENWQDSFDLFAGTSTGAIIAACLAMGKSASEVQNLYKENGRTVFPRKRWPRQGLLCSKYSNAGLRKQLELLFGNTTLGEIEAPLLLPATDISNGGVHVFKSSYHRDFLRDKNVLVADAVLASCSAPTFFPPHTLQDSRYVLADGGLWANNPSLAAAIDAKRRLGAKLDNVRILTIGTGVAKKLYSIQEQRRLGFGWGFLTRWKKAHFIEFLMNLQSEASENMLGLLLDPNQVMRLNYCSDLDLPLDAPRMYADLVTRADKVFTHEADSIRDFLQPRTF